MSKNVIKQDSNFLYEPLWFQNVRSDKIGVIWKDRENYEFRCGYKVPDKVDIIILLYLMLKSQQSEYTRKITTTRYEILKECNLPYRDNKYYLRVEDSLKRWKNVAIHFNGTFYDRKSYYQIGFGILDDYKIDEKNKKVVIHFNENWLLKIKQSKYFQNINFGYYKALKRSLSRRLFEILCKSFIGRSTWTISLTRLGEIIPLTGIKNKEGKKIIYASQVLQKIKPAIKEINKLSFEANITDNIDINFEDLFTISYKIKGEKQNRVIIFEKHPVEIKIETTETTQSNEPKINDLLNLLIHKSKKLEKAIVNYFQEKGFDYVKWNILYTNKNAKKNYSHYLQQALENNWAEEWAEEEKNKAEKELLLKQEEQRKFEEQKRQQELQELVVEQRALFCQAAANLDKNVKEQFWIQADKEIPEDTFRREFSIKIRYAELVFDELNKQGMNFVKEIFGHLGVVSDVALTR